MEIGVIFLVGAKRDARAREEVRKSRNGHVFPRECLSMPKGAHADLHGGNPTEPPQPGDCFTLAGTIGVATINVFEARFGAPVDIDYLIDNEVFLPGCSASSQLLASPNGRYIASVILYGDGMMIFDRHDDMIYKIRMTAFWELNSMDDRSLTGIAREAGVPPQRARIADMIAVADQDPLVQVGYFKVPLSYLEEATDLKWVIRSPHAPHAKIARRRAFN